MGEVSIVHEVGNLEDGGCAKYWKCQKLKAPSKYVCMIFFYLLFKNQTDQCNKNTMKLFFQWTANRKIYIKNLWILQ